MKTYYDFTSIFFLAIDLDITLSIGLKDCTLDCPKRKAEIVTSIIYIENQWWVSRVSFTLWNNIKKKFAAIFLL